MREARKHNNILSIESAVAGGSVALLAGEQGTLVKNETNDCSRAEKIVSVISSILDEAGIALNDLNMVAVSIGPGSYSGIRIGMSTALGLTSALNIPLAGVSVLEAMANATECKTELIAAVPVGKNDVAWQPFEVKTDGNRTAAKQPVLMSSSSFIDSLKLFPEFTLIAHADLLDRIAKILPDHTTWIDAGTRLAEYVGRFALSAGTPALRPQPIYLRNSDAAFRENAF